MAINNTVNLIGNMGNEARIIEKEDRTFAVFSIATTDSYKDDQDQWHDKESIWHDLITFSPTIIETLKALKKGTRIEVTGALSYKPFEVEIEPGKTITKKEASVVVKKLEQALVKKNKAES